MKLVIFDCDGTLADSQNAIVQAMNGAFAALDLKAPTRAETLSIVGLSLPEVFDVLAPAHSAATRAALSDKYRGAFKTMKELHAERDPLFPGAKACVEALARRGDVVLGIATGKSLRGVERLFDQEGWHPHFATIQTADGHPSKPHPSMILTAMAETGAAAHETVMIGDTTYDMAMARAAEVGAIGVAWGYHPVPLLEQSGAHVIVPDFADLAAVIDARLAAQEGRA